MQVLNLGNASTRELPHREKRQRPPVITHALGWRKRSSQVSKPLPIPSREFHQQHNRNRSDIMPKSSRSDDATAVEDHAAMKKQWQTNLEIDLLKSAWIRKDREQHGAHTSPPLSAGK
ncbi:hypothetical protein PHYBOEH_001411 [Phytophthora boehmeriae]|uniref:Uncharacterized protein n=1 Tax=Phytophthora boehmeriae TaxID=109152 RepID=A0A8T1XCJ1_9STRA|nr:hypothetical protein PHYBOEH_001411 [Phytophthora boehmeriae]